MNMRRLPYWVLGLFCITCWVCGPGFSQESGTENLAQEQRENFIAINAKLLCSGCFVIGREPDEFIANDLQRSGENFPTWEEINVAVDWEGKSVTLSTEGVAPRTAVYNGSQGCTLLPRGASGVHFAPMKVVPNLPPADSLAWPMGDRLPDRNPPPEVDRDALNQALDFAFDDDVQAFPQKTRAIVVVYKGELIAERYAPNFTAETRHISWSMGKSITSALVGVLVGRGAFAVTDPVPIAEWQEPSDPRRKIRITDLLHMSSGLDFHTGSERDGLMFTRYDNHRAVYFGAVNVYEYSVSRPLEHPPNTVWRYRNCDPLSLGKIMRDVIERDGNEFLSFPQRALFDKIGMRNMVLEVDPWGNFIMTGFDYGTPRDWARFGLLHLWDGVWQGERILPEGWVDYVRTPAPAHPNKGYGAQFWLNAGKTYESLPEDMFWPAGHHGQLVMIIPSRDVVIVRMGHSALGGFDPYIEDVVKRILDSIEE